MKLAGTTHIVTHELSQGSRNSRRITRLASTRTFSIQRHPSRPVARWHVCPETQRLECAWSLEPAAYEDQLCRSRSRGTDKRTFVARLTMCPSTSEAG